MLKNITVKNVLLVDDNETDNFIHKVVLELNNFAENIIVCDGGKAALDYLRKHEDNDSCLPDIIFLDLNMPVVNGFRFLSEFESLPLSIRSKSKIVILSSSENSRDKERVSSHSHVCAYLTKPLSEDGLAQLREMLTDNKLVFATEEASRNQE